MSTFRVTFHYKREVTAFIEAESESDIDAFLVDNPDFDILEDYPYLIESDETKFDIESEYGDYEVTLSDEITSNWLIVNGELQEKE
jgi:hypothetical protein